MTGTRITGGQFNAKATESEATAASGNKAKIPATSPGSLSGKSPRALPGIIVPVILSGGSGSRLWPKSRKAYPKQLHKLYGDYTMLQHTVNRVGDLAPPIVVCNEDQRFMVAEQLFQVCTVTPDIILEPVGRNTAPAIAAAAYYANNKYDNATLVVLPADHLIKSSEAFAQSLNLALEQVTKGRLITFGVVPTQAETGYGYIKAADLHNPGGSAVVKFVEKPNKKIAEEYITDGSYCWNSGMFVFTASDLLAELERCGAAWLNDCKKSVIDAQQDLDFVRLEKSSFEKCQDISIDFAVMEKTNKAWVVPLASDWNDLGSWDACWATGEKDSESNVLIGDTWVQSCNSCYINASSRLVAAIGLDNIVIVDTEDALLVVNKNKTQNVKDIVDWLKTSQRNECQHHRQVHKPWGSFDLVDAGKGYQVNRIEVKPGASMTMQLHNQRAEHWVVVNGVAKVERDDNYLLIKQNESIYIAQGQKHRLSNPGQTPLCIIEVQTGNYFGDDDVTRFENSDMGVIN